MGRDPTKGRTYMSRGARHNCYLIDTRALPVNFQRHYLLCGIRGIGDLPPRVFDRRCGGRGGFKSHSAGQRGILSDRLLGETGRNGRLLAEISGGGGNGLA